MAPTVHSDDLSCDKIVPQQEQHRIDHGLGPANPRKREFGRQPQPPIIGSQPDPDGEPVGESNE